MRCVHDPSATVVRGQALPCRMLPSPGHAGARIPQKIVVHGTAWGAASLPTQPLGPGVPHTYWDPKTAVTAWDTQIPSRAKPAPLGAAPQQPGWEEERMWEFGLFVPF